MRRFVISAIAVIVGLAGVSAATAQRIPESRAEIQISFAPLVRETAPAVVNIYARRVQQTRQSQLLNDPFFRRFFGENLNLAPAEPRIQNSLGSGVILRADGVVVTNNHVIEGADQITVVLADRRELEASIVGTDERTDLAVLKIDSKGEALRHLELRDSDQIEVGDLVLAIGNPFGVGQTVTSGIVSALARTEVGVSDYSFFIQTDAAINPGNSGGALVTMDGKLVGINTAIFSRSGGSLGIGFATPSNMVRSVVAGLMAGGRVQRPWLGATGQRVTADIASSLGLPRPQGALINAVRPRSPADRAGIRAGDVVLAVEGREIADAASLRFRVATLPVGSTATFDLWRRGGAERVTVALQPPPEDPPRDAAELTGSHPFAGANVANLSPAVIDEMGLDSAATDTGVIIQQVRSGSAASRLGFRANDIFGQVNGEAVTAVAQLRTVLRREAARWRITIIRDGRSISMVVDR
ncbi:MAG: DegQ family serine endoprotease [Rhodospirillales bacterium]|nr:DegQ family serine endoprotease [Rhodospirillales bacterium]